MQDLHYPSLLPGLSGLRAICSLIILWGHIPQPDFCNWGGKFEMTPKSCLPPCCAYIFFVLSGFLAGYKGSIEMSLSAYYEKRAKKMLPLYLGYILATVLAFVLLGRTSDVLNAKILYYLFLIPQVPFCAADGIMPMVHLWFIGTIVLFYLTVPIFSRINDASKPKVALVITVGWALLKWGLYLFVGKDTFAYRFVAVTAFDCLFWGVWLGLAWKRRNTLVVKVGKSRLLAAVLWGLFLGSGWYGDLIPAPARVEYIAILAGLIILNQVSDKPLFSLNNKVCRWIGNISYDIYVVQILVIILLSLLYTRAGWEWPGLVIYAICTVAVFGVASFANWIWSKKKSI